MLKNYAFSGLVLTYTVLLLACSSEPNQDAQAEEASNDKFRLTDQTLSDWQAPPSITMEWVDKVLWLEAGSEPVWWTSKESYDNFAWEFDINSNDLTVLGFGLAPDATGGYMVSLDSDSASLNPKGTILNHARSSWTADQGPEKWYNMRIETDGERIKVFVNQEEVCFTRDDGSLNGILGIQINGRVGLRDFQIKSQEMKQPSRFVEEVYRTDEDHEWIEFFKDQSLEGWTSTGSGSWTFEADGSLKGQAGEEPDFLVSDSSYKDFYLVLDFKIGHNENSGVFIRKHPDSLVSLNDAIECNIYDFNGPAHPYSTGSMVSHARAWYDMVDYEQWNTMEIFARRSLVVIYINQRKASEHLFDSPFVKPGQIALQAGTRVFGDNGPSTVWFRNLRIKDFNS